MSSRFRLRWPDFDITTRRGQAVVQYQAGTASFDRCLAIAGRSGAGKSLFGRSLAGLMPSGLLSSGEPALEYRLPSGEHVPIAHGKIAYVPQSPASALPSAITCSALLQEVLDCDHPDRGSRPDPAYHLERVDLDPLVAGNLHASQLSGGMAQRFAICLALARQPHFLVLDEPTVGLDADTASRVLDLLVALLADGQMGAVVLTHDSRASRVADERVLVERHGRVTSLARQDVGLSL